jgi:hypothetical protein
MYYQRLDVRRAIIDYASANGSSDVRECAFYNARAKSIQRHLDSGPQTPFYLTRPAAIDVALGFGATAFYCSYWRHRAGNWAQLSGRDLVWTTRAMHGGLKFAKEVTAWVLDALEEAGVSKPWVKYSGELGFDLVIPLDAVPCESLAADTDVIGDLQGGLTSYIVGHIRDRFEDVRVDGAHSSIEFKKGSGTCLLSELRARRGLLLAPMSLNPKTGLVSVTIDPHQVKGFSIFQASPEDARGVEWEPAILMAPSLIKDILSWSPAPEEERQAAA